MDLLVIVVGIMVSFLLNEWRQGKEDIRKEQRLLIALREDVRADSISFANELAELSELIELGMILVEREKLPTDPDSVMLLLSSCASYISFPFNDITYEEIRATGAGALIRDKALLRQIIEMYDKHLPMMREYQSIDKWMVLERVFPFLEPRLVLADPDPAVLEGLRNDTQWRNLVTSNAGFKAQMRGEMAEHLHRIDSLGIMLDEAIATTP
ncbi:MAG: hypothetical protein KDB88_11740 [Flavobacteriales bacterium]|nr:hypothetical protein [Flavobacteriales bacterium]